MDNADRDDIAEFVNRLERLFKDHGEDVFETPMLIDQIVGRQQGVIIHLPNFDQEFRISVTDNIPK